MFINRLPRICLAFLALLFLISCGGSGGGAVATSGSGTVATSGGGISGVAASGNPITPSMNGVVTVKDSSTPARTLSTATDANGAYSFSAAQLSGTTAPYMVQISYQIAGVTYYLTSAATAQDLAANATINITPLTDLIIANLAGTIASNVFSNGNFSSILTPTALAAGAAALRTQLLPILTSQGVSASVDLLHQSFAANGTGLDAVLDILKITVDPITKLAIITNRLNNQSITNSLTGANTAVLSGTATTSLSDLQAVSNRLAAFSAYLGTGPSAGDATLLSFFDQARFLDQGRSLASFLQEITTSPTIAGGGLGFTDVVLLPVPAYVVVPGGATASYLVQFTVLQNTAPADLHTFVLYKSATGIWLILGNQQKVQVQAEAFAVSGIINFGSSNQTRALCSGLNLNVNDRGGNGVSFAVVTGTGLPQAGLLLVNNATGSFMAASVPPSSYAGASTPVIQSTNANCTFSSLYALTDGVIGSIAASGEPYTFSLYKNAVSGTPSFATSTGFATYTLALSARPLLAAQLTSSMFTTGGTVSPAFGNVSVATNFGFRWTAPTASGLYASNINVYLSGVTNGGGNFNADVGPYATSANIAIGPITGFNASSSPRGFTTEYVDAVFRQYWTQY